MAQFWDAFGANLGYFFDTFSGPFFDVLLAQALGGILGLKRPKTGWPGPAGCGFCIVNNIVSCTYTISLKSRRERPGTPLDTIDGKRFQALKRCDGRGSAPKMGGGSGQGVVARLVFSRFFRTLFEHEKCAS